MSKFKKLILGNLPLKVLSFFIGYTLWYVFGHAQIINTKLNVPLCFYGAEKSMNIQAPEMVHIELSGKRAILNTIDLDNLAIHVDARELVQGPQPIQITQERLFLPESIKLIHYTPAQIVVTMQQIATSPEYSAL